MAQIKVTSNTNRKFQLLPYLKTCKPLIMPSIDNQQPSQSVVQFFNMFGSQANAPPPPTVTKTPNRSTHTRKNSKQLQARASSLSPKPNRQNKLPKINNNNHNKHNTTPNHKFNAKHDNRNNANGSNSGRTPQRNSTHRGSCSSRDTGKQQQHKTTTNTSKHKNNCPQNENNHSDSSLSVKSSKSSFVKLATLTNKSDPDSDNGGSNNSHRYNTRARYQRNSESSFHFENQANSELFAGSSSAPDAKSLPLPPTAWLGAAIGKPSGNNLNNVPKNHLKNNNAPQLTESNSLNPTVQNLFASMALVSTSA